MLSNSFNTSSNSFTSYSTCAESNARQQLGDNPCLPAGRSAWNLQLANRNPLCNEALAKMHGEGRAVNSRYEIKPFKGRNFPESKKES